MSFYTAVVRPALFALEAERAHEIVLSALALPLAPQVLQLADRRATDARLRHTVFGIAFDHPLGLAAGLDKQGTALPSWGALGFAYAEIGTVTPRAQPGNPQPRLFRLPEDRAIINRFGFNSAGAAGVARNLERSTPAALHIGINVGRNRETPNEHAVDDYVHAVGTLRRFASYFVINVSSPNTAGLRDLQEARVLRQLVERVVAAAQHVPVLIKVAPDGDATMLLQSVDAAIEGGAAGVVATNTTIARDRLVSAPALREQPGGLSGAPLRDAADNMCRRLFSHLGPRIPIIGVGGIFTPDDAYERIRAGASLVQVYTALVYEGPGIVRRIVAGLSDRLRRDGFASVADAVGVDVKRSS